MALGVRRPLVWAACFVAVSSASQADVFDEFEPDIPTVLSPVRLHQPLTEVPASVTLITAEQIRQWGIRRLVDVFQYVPGMFVAQELDSNQSSVVYHSGDVALARRLEVLVDGRSIYRATFASVDWDQFNVALDDIERIEITRGASASAYGMNAFQGVINLITRHPADSARAALRLSAGQQQRKQGYGSIGFEAFGAPTRLSLFAHHEGEQASNNPVEIPEQNWVEGGHWSGTSQLDDDSELNWQVGRQRLRRNLLGDENFHIGQPQQQSITDMVQLKLKSADGASGSWQARVAWQAENQEKQYQACTPSMAYDADLGRLYRNNRSLAIALGYGVLPLSNPSTSAAERQQIEQVYQGLAYGVVSASQLEAYLASQGQNAQVSEQDYELVRTIAARAVNAGALDEVTCGEGDYDLYEQRLEMELEYTRWWSDTLRSVQGLTFRRDEAASETWFGGKLSQSNVMAFSSVEYRFQPDWLAFLSLTADYQQNDGVYFSPRLALTHLLDDRSSVRFQYASGHRSPDLAERYMAASAQVNGLTDNYLGLASGELFLSTDASDWEGELNGESIHSWELGYYGMFSDPRLSLDVKVFHERMQRLIHGKVSLLNGSMDENSGMSLTGLEWQLDWALSNQQKLWLVGLVQNRSADSDSSQELTVGAENSVRLAWTGQRDDWQWMLGGWYDQGRYRSGGSYSQSELYTKRRLTGRLARSFQRWEVALESQYDPLAGRLQYERNERWNNWLTARWSW